MKSKLDFHPKLFSSLKAYTRADFMTDLMAGIIVGIVALPLAIAFGIASGVSPEKGIITAIVAGFLISLLGGSKVQIGGPTGAFIVIIYGIIQEYGVEGLMVATLLAGVMLVDRDEDGLQVLEVEQEVVYEVAYLPPVSLPDEGREANPVQPAQRMVGSEDEAPLPRHLPAHVEREVEIADERLHEVHALQPVVPREDVVYLLLVHRADEVIYHETRYLPCRPGGFLP